MNHEVLQSFCLFICRNGNISAQKVTKLTPSSTTTYTTSQDIYEGVKQVNVTNSNDRYEGVVCSMKDSYGFIERADAVKEIFFHYSEYKGSIDDLMPGDDVEFAVQSRNVSYKCHVMVE